MNTLAAAVSTSLAVNISHETKSIMFPLFTNTVLFSFNAFASLTINRLADGALARTCTSFAVHLKKDGASPCTASHSPRETISFAWIAPNRLVSSAAPPQNMG